MNFECNEVIRTNQACFVCELELEVNEENKNISTLPPETSETIGAIGNDGERNNQSRKARRLNGLLK